MQSESSKIYYHKRWRPSAPRSGAQMAPISAQIRRPDGVWALKMAPLAGEYNIRVQEMDSVWPWWGFSGDSPGNHPGLIGASLLPWCASTSCLLLDIGIGVRNQGSDGLDGGIPSQARPFTRCPNQNARSHRIASGDHGSPVCIYTCKRALMRLQVESPLHPCKGVKVFAFAVYHRRRLTPRFARSSAPPPNLT